MPRVREITLDSLKIKIAPLSWDEAEAYIKEGKEMLERDPKPTNEEWALRTLKLVTDSLNKAAGATNGNSLDVKKLTGEYDMVTISEIHDEIMKMSGLLTKTPAPGEGQATSTSR